MTDLYGVVVNSLGQFCVSGRLATPIWREYWGLAWIERGCWVGARQQGKDMSTLKWYWFVTSRMDLSRWTDDNDRPELDETLLSGPARELLRHVPPLVTYDIQRWVSSVPADRQGVDGVPMALHKIEDPVARYSAVTAYLSNRI